MSYLTTIGPSPDIHWHEVSDRLETLPRKTVVSQDVADILGQTISRYTPEEGDSIEDVALALGVAASSLKINLFSVPKSPMEFDGGYVSILSLGGKKTTFPANPAPQPAHQSV